MGEGGNYHENRFGGSRSKADAKRALQAARTSISTEGANERLVSLINQWDVEFVLGSQ